MFLLGSRLELVLLRFLLWSGVKKIGFGLEIRVRVRSHSFVISVTVGIRVSGFL